jgi:hypothetical protein
MKREVPQDIPQGNEAKGPTQSLNDQEIHLVSPRPIVWKKHLDIAGHVPFTTSSHRSERHRFGGKPAKEWFQPQIPHQRSWDDRHERARIEPEGDAGAGQDSSSAQEGSILWQKGQLRFRKGNPAKVPALLQIIVRLPINRETRIALASVGHPFTLGVCNFLRWKRREAMGEAVADALPLPLKGCGRLDILDVNAVLVLFRQLLDVFVQRCQTARTPHDFAMSKPTRIPLTLEVIADGDILPRIQDKQFELFPQSKPLFGWVVGPPLPQQSLHPSLEFRFRIRTDTLPGQGWIEGLFNPLSDRVTRRRRRVIVLVGEFIAAERSCVASSGIGIDRIRGRTSDTSALARDSLRGVHVCSLPPVRLHL